MIQAYAFILKGELATLRLQANGGDVSAEREIGEVHNRVDHALGQGAVAPEVLMLLARAFARAELDPRRSLKLTRFRGARQAFNGGFSDAQDASPYSPEFRRQMVDLVALDVIRPTLLAS